MITSYSKKAIASFKQRMRAVTGQQDVVRCYYLYAFCFSFDNWRIFNLNIIGIYHNDDKTFLVWCNEEDHLRIISMQMGGDLGQIYRRLVSAVNDIEKRIPFSHHDRLGFLTFCPTNLGNDFFKFSWWKNYMDLCA